MKGKRRHLSSVVSVIALSGGAHAQNLLYDGDEGLYEVSLSGTTSLYAATPAGTTGLAVGPNGKVFVVTESSGATSITQVNSSGTESSFVTAPTGDTFSGWMAFGPSGNLYDTGYTKINGQTAYALFKITPSGQVSLLYDILSFSGSPPYLESFAVGAGDNVFVNTGSLASNWAITEVSPDGTASAYSSDLGFSIAVNGSGDMFLGKLGLTGSGDPSTIDKILPNGTATLFATLPSGGNPYGIPEDMVFGANGDMYVVDNGLGDIYQITPSGVVSNYTPGGLGPSYVTGLAFAPAAVPEPSMMAMFSLGLAVVLARRQRRDGQSNG